MVDWSLARLIASFANFANFAKDSRGHVATIFGIAAIPLTLGIGAAVDYSRVSSAGSKLQTAIDSAVLSGVGASAAQRTHPATIAYVANIFNTDAQSIGQVASSSFVFNSDGSLTGTATVAVPTVVMALGGTPRVSLNVSATAMPAASSTNVCILLLDPSASQALLMNSGANINAPNCEVDVASQGNPAAIFNSGTTLATSKTCIRGTSYISNGGTHPNLSAGCTTVSDPFAGNLPAPPSTVCAGPNANGGNFNGGTVNLSPGVYCGWFNFNSSPTVNLAAGTYVIENGGWNVGGGTWTGNGVTFYFADTSKIQFNSGMNMTLSAPTSGTYSGILFYEKSGLALSQFVFDDSVAENLTGLIYLPSRNVTFNSTSNISSPQFTLVADTAIFDTANWNLSPGPMKIAGTGSGSASGNARLLR
jgi:Flp pilus assembly protein TadG